MEHMALAIEGMTCGHCVMAVKKALGELGGVEVESVEIGAAKVGYDAARVSREQLVEAVEEEGYTVTATR